MFDFSAAVQTALSLSPAITLPVIAVLVIAIVAQAYFDARRSKNRLRAQAKRLGKMTAMLLAAVTDALGSEMNRRVNQAIEFTYDTLKGTEKNTTIEDILFGGTPFKSESFSSRRRQFRDRDSFADLAEAFRPRGDGGTVLKETLRPGEGPNGEKYTRPSGESIKSTGDDGAGFGEKGPRPYHTAHADQGPRDF